jgi:hypothetical protein
MSGVLSLRQRRFIPKPRVAERTLGPIAESTVIYPERVLQQEDICSVEPRWGSWIRSWRFSTQVVSNTFWLPSPRFGERGWGRGALSARVRNATRATSRTFGPLIPGPSPPQSPSAELGTGTRRREPLRCVSIHASWESDSVLSRSQDQQTQAVRPVAQAGGVTVIAFLFLILVALTMTAQAESLSSEQNEFFESKVRPILVEHCYKCHSADADEIEAGLVLDSKQGWMNGGDSGAAIVPGNLDESLLIHAIRYQEDVVSGMPPKSKLPDQKLAILEQWVSMGAPDPRTDAKTGSPIKEFDLQARFEEHWSWRPIVSAEIPSTDNTNWSDAPIDRFVLEKLEQAGLKPAREADRRTWLRRVHLDVIGLPPSVDQIERFLADHTPDAYQNVVTGLLDSPHYGEKWARHWMDLVRYSETYGHEFDYPIHHAHEYRDYLIRAMNADVPYDQFIREQVAGDLLPEPRRHPTEDFNESIIGTGFWYFHDATHAPTDVLNNEADIIGNQVDVFSKSFLGLTVACARCHDHKFDAISAADYYALSAYIQSSCRQFAPLDPGRKIEAINDQIEPYRAQADRGFRLGATQRVFRRHAAGDAGQSGQTDGMAPGQEVPLGQSQQARPFHGRNSRP